MFCLLLDNIVRQQIVNCYNPIMSELENFEAFTFTYDASRDLSDLHFAVQAIDRYRYMHAQVDRSKLADDDLPPRSLQLPLVMVWQSGIAIENSADVRAALLDLCIDPRLN
jgi:hypothetical protein